MKYILFLVFAFISLNADEIKRIEAIVNDITQLRLEYTQCQEELKSQSKSDLTNSKEENYKKIIKDLNNQINIYKKDLKIKENTIKKLSLEESSKVKIKENSLKNLDSNKCETVNSFPKLMMKEKFQKKEQLEFFPASAFRFNKQSAVFDAIDGDVVETWEEHTSFTSNQRTKNWIKITGYFVNKVWQAATRELWVKSSDVTKR